MSSVDENNDEERGKNIVVILYHANVVSVACYNTHENAIYADRIATNSENLEEVLYSVKVLCDPTYFIVHPKIAENASMLGVLLSSKDGTERNHYPFKVEKRSSWNSDNCLQLLASKLFIKSERRGQPPQPQPQSQSQSQSQPQTHQNSNYSSNRKATGNNANNSSSNTSLLRHASAIDLSDTLVLQALNVLLLYMRDVVFHLDDPSALIVVNAVKSISFDQYLQLDAISLYSLHVFHEDFHPNLVRGPGRYSSKEGYSLFSLFDRARSLPGRQKLRDWMTKPLRNKAVILYRQSGVALVVRPENMDFVSYIAKLQQHIFGLPSLLLRFKKVAATVSEWDKLHKTLHYGLLLVDAIAQFIHQERLPQDKTFLCELLGDFNPDPLRQLKTLLEDVIDFNSDYSGRGPGGGSHAHHQVYIRDGFDANLDNLRSTYDNIESLLTSLAHEVLEQIPLLSALSVQYVPQVGYLIVVDEDQVQFLPGVSAGAGTGAIGSGAHNSNNSRPETAASGCTGATQLSYYDDGSSEIAAAEDGNHTDINSPEFTFIFQQEEKCYFKNARMREMDDSIGDIKNTILDAQKAILYQLEEAILDVEVELRELNDVLATLDAICSLGIIATENHFVCPEIVDDRHVIIIKAGKHPLQAMTCSSNNSSGGSGASGGSSFVPNDTYITPEKHVALITGANGSGKSVYLKQVGLLVFLAQIGSFLPCEKAVIGITDKILTRISSVETVSSPQSAFTLDISQIGLMLARYSENSLCLLDEFGKGTSPLDGIALMAAIVKHFAAKNKAKVLCTLHFTEILHPSILSPELLQESVHVFKMDSITHTHRKDAVDDFGNPLDGQDGEGEGEGGDGNTDRFAYTSTPLFKLKLGVASSSDGLACAEAAGVPMSIVRRAGQVKTALLNSSTPLPQCSSSSLNSDTISSSRQYQLALRCFLETDSWMHPQQQQQQQQLHQSDSSSSSDISSPDAEKLMGTDINTKIQAMYRYLVVQEGQ